MSWRDEEIDELFRDAADQQSFEFRSEYFKDIEKQLPIKRSRKPFFWWFTSSVFLVTFMGWGILEGTNFEQKRSDAVLNDLDKDLIARSGNLSDHNSTQGGVVAKNNITEHASGTKNQDASPLKVNDNLFIQDHSMEENKESEVKTNQIPVVTETAKNPTEVTEVPTKIGSLELNTITAVSRTLDLENSNLYAGNKRGLKFYFELGGGIGQGWVSTDPATVNGNIFVNGGIGTRLGKFNLTAGLGMRATKLGDLQIMERTKIYGLGYSTYENQYTFQSFYSIEAPVNVNYQMGRHAVGVGILPSFNLCTGLTRTEWIDGVQIVQRSGVSNVGLFSKIGMAGTIGYAYSVNEHMQIGARGAIQFIEPLSSDRFVGTRVKMPFEGQVYLRRTFDFRK